MTVQAQQILLPGSVGELFDRITILRIKVDHIQDVVKRGNVQLELTLLEDVAAGLTLPAESAALIDQLHAVNAQLWQIEDDIRDCERAGDFSQTFITLARSVYITNDQRASLKRQLSEMSGSQIIEEKSYAAY